MSVRPGSVRAWKLLAAGLLAQAGMLGAVTRVAGLGRAGWLAGGGSGLALSLAVARYLPPSGAGRPGPADVVTMTRATMACTVAGLVARAGSEKPAARTLTALSAGALALDAVDGAVARHTRTASAFGARFDGEVDAFLILALSVHAARSFGLWVLAGGLARYGFAAAGSMLPWMRRALPPRYWRKVATATEGIALAAATAPFVPRSLTTGGLLVGLLLICESFGRDVVWLWRRRALSA